MSTAKKRTIKYTAFFSILVLTVAYFSLLSPTSAYFYKTETKETTLKFALFDVKENQTVFDNESVLKFEGATKLADFDELLFDDVAIVKEVTLTNEGEADARILAHITPDADSVAKGLRYIAFIEKVENAPSTVAEGGGTEETTTEAETATEATTTTTKVEKGKLKAKLENLLGITEGSTPEEVETALNDYNEEFRKNDDVVLRAPVPAEGKPGESAKVTIVFWSEYDNVMSHIDDAEATVGAGESIWQNAGEIENIEYLCHVELIASQDRDEAVNSILETTTVVQ